MDVGVGGGELLDVGLGGRKGNDDVQMEVVGLDTGGQSPGGGVGYPVVRLLSSLGHAVLSSILEKKVVAAKHVLRGEMTTAEITSITQRRMRALKNHPASPNRRRSGSSPSQSPSDPNHSIPPLSHVRGW